MTWYRSRTRRRSSKASTVRTCRFRPFVEPLEDRLSPAVFTVISTRDVGAGSGTAGDLRYCINLANLTPGLDIIQFAIPGAGPHTIQPRSALPRITDAVVLDATTQPGYAGAPLIELDGSLIDTGCLVLSGGNSTVRGFVINRFTSSEGPTVGIAVLGEGKGGNVIEHNYIGTNLAGTGIFANERTSYGVIVRNDGNVIRNNVISGNGSGGILLQNVGQGDSTNNLIVNNRIGTDWTGTVDLGQVLYGIFFLNAGNANRIEGNVISGNDSVGIYLDSENNVVAGNFIGTDVTGTRAVGNGTGIIFSNTSNNVIGGTTAVARNVISGNRGAGINMGFPGNTGNLVLGNFIGTDVSGTVALGNGTYGIILHNGASNNTIGGTAPGSRNVISGNARDGIRIDGAGGNVVAGNFIGTDATGTAALGNLNGVVIQNASNNVIGGTTPGARNVISGNVSSGVVVGNGSQECTGNVVLGNYIGTDVTGMAALPNLYGVTFAGIAAGNTVGGRTAAARNIISGNSAYGVVFSTTGTAGNVAEGNYIGLAADGNTPLGQSLAGVIVNSGSQGNLIGGAAPGAGNVISANGDGVWLRGSFNRVQGNFIGTDATGTLARGNGAGVVIQGDDNLVGGTEPGAGNRIAYSTIVGVEVISGEAGLSPVRNAILGNSIYANAGPGIDLLAFGEPHGVTPNDPGDTDTGANNLANSPVLTQTTASGDSRTVLGQLNGRPNTTFRIEFFANDAYDPSGHGEGQVYLGAVTVTTDANGFASFSFTYTADPAHPDLTATATGPDGTSEFSGRVLSPAQPPSQPPAQPPAEPPAEPPAQPPALPPTLDIVDAFGDEGQVIPLLISVVQAVPDLSEILSVQVSGVPAPAPPLITVGGGDIEGVETVVGEGAVLNTSDQVVSEFGSSVESGSFVPPSVSVAVTAQARTSIQASVLGGDRTPPGPEEQSILQATQVAAATLDGDDSVLLVEALLAANAVPAAPLPAVAANDEPLGPAARPAVAPAEAQAAPAAVQEADAPIPLTQFVTWVALPAAAVVAGVIWLRSHFRHSHMREPTKAA